MRPARRVHVGLMFATAAVAMFMTSVNASIVATALDTLQRSLGTSVNWAGWTITAYALVMLVMLPVAGRLADRYGRRRVFVWSAVAFTAGSLACGFAPNIGMLIVLRRVQAAGGAGFTPAATGLFTEYFGRNRDRAVSLYGSIYSVGAMTGPVFGGLFVAHLSWRDIFFVNVPVGVVVIALALWCIPKDRGRAGGARFDTAGALVLGVGLVAGMLAASALGEQQPAAARAALATPLAAVCVWAFVWFFRHIRRTPHPFITPRLITGRGFGPINIVTTVFGGTAMGAIALVPLYAANRYGIVAIVAGALLVAQGAADGVFTVASALLLRRTGYRLPLYVGSAAVIVGLALLGVGAVGGVAPVAWLAGAAVFIGVGTGMLGPTCRNAGLELAPQSAAMVAALRSMEWQIGSIVMVSVSTAVMTAAATPASAQAWAYVVAAVVLACAIPLIHRVRDHHGAW